MTTMKQVKFGDLKAGDRFNFNDRVIAEMHVKCDPPEDRGWYRYYGSINSLSRAFNDDKVWIEQSPEDRIKELEEENAKLKADLEAAKATKEPKLVDMDTLKVGDVFYLKDAPSENLIRVEAKYGDQILGCALRSGSKFVYSPYYHNGDHKKVYKVN